MLRAVLPTNSAPAAQAQGEPKTFHRIKPELQIELAGQEGRWRTWSLLYPISR